MKKRIYFLVICVMGVLPVLLANPIDSTKQDVKPIDAKTFRIESTQMANQLDSLMALHIFKFKKSALPKNYDSTYIPVFQDSIYRKRIAALDASTPLELDYNPVVRRYIDMYTLKKRDQVSRMLGLAQYYFPMFEEVLDRYNMPLELKYLAVVESALNPLAKSRVGATGLWQFMYATGKIMGLNSNSYVDERNDPYRSTVAACEYMTKMYKIYGDWNLVLAAYNSGPGNVNKAIRRSGGKRNYWELRSYLPRETAGYVPAFIAATYTMKYAKEHNLYASRVVPHYGNTDTVFVREQISFDQLNMWLGIDRDVVEFLNPQYKLGIIPSIKGQPQFLALPRQTMGLFIDNEDTLYAYARAEFNTDRVGSSNATTAVASTSNSSRTVHKVRSGDNLGKLATKYGVSVSDIKRWNNLRSSTIQVGQKLAIYSKNSAPQEAQESSSGPTYYTVRKGDTLNAIASRYPGVSSSMIAEWNNINPNSIRPGMKLVVRKGSN